MKSILRILVLCALLASLAVSALADDVPVYWQLESIQVTTSTENRFGPAEAATDVTAISTDDVREMIEAVRSESSMAVGASRASTDRHAHADYTVSGVPALVPGAASARLTLTANTAADPDSFYLYGTVDVNGKRTLRFRNTGAWVHRVGFPRTAEAGAVRSMTITGQEIHDFAVVSTS